MTKESLQDRDLEEVAAGTEDEGTQQFTDRYKVMMDTPSDQSDFENPGGAPSSAELPDDGPTYG